MRKLNPETGIINGWYWRFITLSVVGVVVLEVIAYYALHYPLIGSLPIAVLVVAYIVAPRVKEKRLANVLASVIATYVLSALALMTLQYDWVVPSKDVMPLLQNLGFALLMGVVMSYAYLRLTEWSEKKRDQLDAKRTKPAEAAPERPAVRHHSKKRKKKR